MNAVSPALFEKLVGKRLSREVEHVLSIGRQGFDVRIDCAEPLIVDAFERFLTRNAGDQFIAVHPVRGFSQFETSRKQQLDEGRYEPLVLLACAEAIEGAGLVTCALPEMIDLLPNVPSAIRTILGHYGLEVYQPVFDAAHSTTLKPLLNRGLLSVFIDAVVQVAYYEGACGDAERAQTFLRGLTRPPERDQLPPIGPESIAAVLQWVLEREVAPHHYAKSLLTYFTVYVKELSHVQASQVLGISRTTLQTHLKVAARCKVGDAFGGYRKPSGNDRQTHLPHSR